MATKTPSKPSKKTATKTVRDIMALRADVDVYQDLNAQIKSLTAQRDELKMEFIKSGFQTIQNLQENLQANVIYVEGRAQTDWQAIAKALGAPQALIDAHTEMTDGYHKVTITAPKQ